VIGAGTVMSDIAATTGSAGPIPRSPRRPPWSAPSRSATGPRWPATSAMPRRPPTRPRRSSSTARASSPSDPPARAHPDRWLLRALGGHDAGARRDRDRDRAARARARDGRGPRPADAAPRPRPRVRHAVLRRGHGGRHAPRIRERRAPAGPRGGRERGARRPCRAGRGQGADLRAALRRCEPVPALHASEPRYRQADAPRPGARALRVAIDRLAQ